jgi:hypothetical protein
MHQDRERLYAACSGSSYSAPSALITNRRVPWRLFGLGPFTAFTDSRKHPVVLSFLRFDFFWKWFKFKLFQFKTIPI